MENLGLIIAIVGGSLGMITVMVSMFLWIRSEANADRRYLHEISKEDRKDILNLIRAIEMKMEKK